MLKGAYSVIMMIKDYGLIAQEVQKVAPDLVRDNGSQFFDKDDLYEPQKYFYYLIIV